MMGCSEDTGENAASGEAVHVALGRDLKKGSVILNWVFRNLRGMEIVIVHVHKPPKLIPMKMGGKFPIHVVTQEEAETYISVQRAHMEGMLRSYMHLCAREKISAKKLVIETEDVHKGIVYLVGQHQIKRLVMGLRSIKGQPVLEGGLLSCQIWLVYNGKLAFTREALLQQINVEFTGGGNQGDSTLSPESANESSESYRDNAAKEMETELPFVQSPEAKAGSSKADLETEEAGPSKEDSATEEASLGKEDFESEDIRELLMKLADAVHVVYRQRLELARQMFELKQEFIDFSLQELEEATNHFLVKNKNNGQHNRPT